jgi:hypothetical protein
MDVRVLETVPLPHPFITLALLRPKSTLKWNIDVLMY